jgi:hypothetical protein
MTDTFEPLASADGSPPSVGNAHSNTQTLKTKTMIEGKILWIEPGDENTAAQEAEAHVVIKDGRMVKNRFGKIAPSEEYEKSMKRNIHLQLMVGALAGGPIDFEDGKGKVTPLDRGSVVSELVADIVQDVWSTWTERNYL